MLEVIDMLKNNYLAVVSFQLELEITCNHRNDVLLPSPFYYAQMKQCIQVLKDKKPHIAIFPEMSYQKQYEKELQLLSHDSFIVFGSTYLNSLNYTKVFYKGKNFDILKRYACGSEPMVRILDKPSIHDFLEKHLLDHTFEVEGNKIYVLNCLEYYQVAYYIARDPLLNENLFGFIVPCSNSNPNVFLQESKAIHNHNERLYSFVCNRVKPKEPKQYGRSYIFGPIQYHEKDWLAEEGIQGENHPSSILTLSQNIASYSYGWYAIPKVISQFGRSDFYISTPKQVTIHTLI